MKKPASFPILALVAGAVATPATASPARLEGAAPPGAPAAPASAVIGDFAALAKAVADASGPHVIRLSPGIYRGNLTVARPVGIVGGPGVVLEGTGDGSVVTISSNDVTVEGAVVRHSGRRSTTEDAGIKATGDRVRLVGVHVEDTLFGISLQRCHRCLVSGAAVDGGGDDAELRGDGIKLWESDDSVVENSRVDGARDVVVWYTRHAVLDGNVVRHGRYGTHFMYAHDAVVRRSRVEGNVVGIFVMYSQRLLVEGNVLGGARGAAGMGIGFKESDAVTVRGNWIVGNTTGTYLDDTPRTPEQPVLFAGNVLALNDAALRLHAPHAGLRFEGNDFRSNAATVEVDGGGDALACDVRGNHFSDYEGYDLDGDGIGDVEYRVSALSAELEGAHPSLRFFRGTAAMQLVDAVAHAVPVLEQQTLLRDPAPLVRAPEVPRP